MVDIDNPDCYPEPVLVEDNFCWLRTCNSTFLFYIYFRYFFPLRKKEPGFKYVTVNYDGSVQELNDEEDEYLNTKYEGGDGNRPYIKSRYDQKTANGSLDGYILRRRVPKHIRIQPLIESFQNLPA